MKSPPERKYLRDLTKAVSKFLSALDAEMKNPASRRRGQNVADLANDLQVANDRAREFVLGGKTWEELGYETLSRFKSLAQGNRQELPPD